MVLLSIVLREWVAIGMWNVATLGFLPLFWLLDTGHRACSLQLEELSLDSLMSPRKVTASSPQSEHCSQFPVLTPKQ